MTISYFEPCRPGRGITNVADRHDFLASKEPLTMNRRPVAAALLTLALAATVTACGSDSGTSVSDQQPTNDKAVAWVEQVCKTVEAGGQKLSTLPKIDPTNPQAAKDGLVGYLGSLVDALDGVAKGIRAAGVPPVADGQQTVDNALGTIAKVQGALDGARTKLTQATTADPVSFQKAMADATAGIGQLDPAGPTKDLKANVALRDAFSAAPTCKRIDAASS
jgi:hypothetical protein